MESFQQGSDVEARQPFVETTINSRSFLRSRWRCALLVIGTLSVGIGFSVGSGYALGSQAPRATAASESGSRSPSLAQAQLPPHAIGPTNTERLEELLGRVAERLDATTTRDAQQSSAQPVETTNGTKLENVLGKLVERLDAKPMHGAHRFQKTSPWQPTASYTRRCSFYNNNPCTPPRCSLENHLDLGIDCASTSCERICLGVTSPSSWFPGDADGHPITCADESASIGAGSKPALVSSTLEWTAAESSFMKVDLFGGGGGGSGSKNIGKFEDGASLVVGTAQASTEAAHERYYYNSRRRSSSANYRGVYQRQGVTARGQPWFAKDDASSYIFWDSDCSGYGFGAGWFIHNRRPDVLKRHGLVGGDHNACTFIAYLGTDDASVPLGGRSWQVGSARENISIERSTTEKWVCGGGGGGGAHVQALLNLKAGHTYRLELGSGGHGSKGGDAAASGQSTRLLERREGQPWYVLAEAAGGFGAGAYNEDFEYSPGGQGGHSSPHEWHLETTPGTPGQASRQHFSGSNEILAPQSLVRRQRNPDSHAWEVCSFGGRDLGRDLGSSPPYCNTAARQPCGDLSYLSSDIAVRFGCSGQSNGDFFLTCSGTFNMGVNRSQCYGVACVQNGQKCEVFGSDVYLGHVSRTSFFSDGPGPTGGMAIGATTSLAPDAGAGGAGTCPVFNPLIVSQGPPEYGTVPTFQSGPPHGIAGKDGKAGAAIIFPCSRAGAYTLALQRCPGAPEWTLHGLWPAGVRDCSDQRFVSSFLDRELRGALATKWPTCGRDQDSFQDNEEFWAHEWEMHGTCTGLAQRAYFLESLRLLSIHAAYCVNVTRAKCHLCLTADWKLCGGLQGAEDVEQHAAGDV